MGGGGLSLWSVFPPHAARSLPSGWTQHPSLARPRPPPHHLLGAASAPRTGPPSSPPLGLVAKRPPLPGWSQGGPGGTPAPGAAP